MRNKCKSLIKAGIVAAMASSPFVVPALAGNMVYDSDFTTDRGVPSVSQRQGSAATTLLNGLIGGADGNPTLRNRPELGPEHANSTGLTGSAPYANAKPREFVIRANSIAAPSDVDTATALGGPGFPLDDFLNPGTGIHDNDPLNSAVVDIRGIASHGGTRGGIDLDPIEMLGPVSVSIAPYGNIGSSKGVQDLGAVLNLSQEDQDRPLVIKWIHSLLEAVGINNRCSNPDGCDSRLAVKE